MTRQCSVAATVALLCAVLWPTPLFAQQPAAALSASQPPASAQGRGSAAGQQPVAAPARAGQPTSRPAAERPQGFSVVLVVGDLQGPAGDEDVPAAARRALADMKDFLPYKSYKLVDAAWIVGTTHAVSRLRGPEDRDYELEITTSDPRMTRLAGSGLASTPGDPKIGVSFSLRDTGGGRDADGPSATDSTLPALRRQLGGLQNQYTEARAKYSGPHPEVQRLEAELGAMERRIEAQEQQIERRIGAQARTANRAVINTSFTMDIGETVVVGTSRLTGNSKALIALLTAVPQKSSPR